MDWLEGQGMMAARVARATNWIEALPAAARKELVAAGQVRRYEAGETVYNLADNPDSIHLIQSGSAYWSLTRRTGESLLLRIAREGDVFGEVVLSDSAPAPLVITARTELTTLAIPRADVHRIAESHPKLYGVFATALGRRLRGSLKIIEEIALLALPERARARLGRMALEMEPELAGATAVRLDITQNELSMMLAASRPATNKALSRLEERGEITIHFKGLDVHPALLRAMREQ